MDQFERYLHLSLLGPDSFLKAVAPAALLRQRARPDSWSSGDRSSDSRQRNRLLAGYSEDTLLAHLEYSTRNGSTSGEFEVYPLAKKPGAPFADMITIGRTSNNDVVLKDVTVSRFHAYFRSRDNIWFVCDAGSKNGTTLRGDRLVSRREEAIESGDLVRIGDIATTFYTAEALYDVLRPLTE